jgi:hypothetical protein
MECGDRDLRFLPRGLTLNGLVPATNATSTCSVPVISIYHSFRMFGHSANIVAALVGIQQVLGPKPAADKLLVSHHRFQSRDKIAGGIAFHNVAMPTDP